MCLLAQVGHDALEVEAVVDAQRRGVQRRLLLHRARVQLLLAPEALPVQPRLVRERLGRQPLRCSPGSNACGRVSGKQPTGF